MLSEYIGPSVDVQKTSNATNLRDINVTGENNTVQILLDPTPGNQVAGGAMVLVGGNPVAMGYADEEMETGQGPRGATITKNVQPGSGTPAL